MDKPAKDERTGGFSFGIPNFAAHHSFSYKPAIDAPAATNDDTSKVTVSSKEKMEKHNLFTFPEAKPDVKYQWRDMEWTEEKKTNLMKTISSYTPSSADVSQAQVLLLGPVGSGKSSFISSVQSVFNGRVTNRAMVGSSSTSFTKKLQSFNIHGQKGENPTGLTLCDMMGLGGEEMTGPTLHDILSIIKGHVPEGHKFSPDQPVRSETVGYVKRPSLQNKIHCVAFVVDGSKLLTYPKSLSTTFQQLREHISDLGVHQVALMTHIDQICSETNKDATQVYKSRIIREMMSKAGAMLGMSISYIVPVKNYSSQLDLDLNTDVLLLSAVDHILHYADLHFQDNTSNQLRASAHDPAGRLPVWTSFYSNYSESSPSSAGRPPDAGGQRSARLASVLCHSSDELQQGVGVGPELRHPAAQCFTDNYFDEISDRLSNIEIKE